MTDEDLIELVSAGERPGVEFKNARARTDPSFNEVVRAILGMANRRDGGVIIVGVEDNGSPTGLTAAQIPSWQNPDHLRQAVAPFADPYVYIDVDLMVSSADGLFKGRVFAILRVHEFDDVPVLCG